MCLKKLRLLTNAQRNPNLTELENDIQELKANYEISRIRRFAKIFLVGFFFGKNTENRVAELTVKIQTRINENISEINKLTRGIEDSGTYLIYPEKASFLAKIDQIKSEIKSCEENNVLSKEFISDATRSLDENIQLIKSYNRKFVNKRKIDYKHLWFKGSISLDDEQQTAIVTDDKYNLVVAAAGSGKTEVLITRIAYLIKRKPDGVLPNRILAIAYQRKAKEQIEQRLWQRYGIGEVNVKTFHKLGKDILEQSGRIIERTDIVNDNKKFGFIQSYFDENVHTNPEFYKLFIRYMKTVRDKDEPPTDSDKKAVVNYAKERKYIAMDGTKVNSNSEKEIMDYLLTHKVNDKPIEVKYEPDLDGFRPDFYLPQFDVFIEHWGIDKNGNVPKWFSQSSRRISGFYGKEEAMVCRKQQTSCRNFCLRV